MYITVKSFQMNTPSPKRRKRLRLPGYDYSQPGAYYITLVSYHRELIFGDIVDGEFLPNSFGCMVIEAWEALEKRYPFVQLDASMLMPNHFHGVLFLVEKRTDYRDSSLPVEKIKPLGQIIGVLKTTSAKQINLARGTPGEQVWQADFYERIIRNDIELDRFRGYIRSNPIRWEDDENGLKGMPTN